MSQKARLPRKIHVSDLRPVIVVWEDAAVHPDFDGPPEGVPDLDVENQTIGFLLRSNKREVILVRDVTIADNTIRWPYRIPRRMVKEVRDLMLAPPKETPKQMAEPPPSL